MEEKILAAKCVKGGKMTEKYSEEDEKAVKEFLLDEECLNELLPWTCKFNIFDVLKISRMEIRHSNMLGWLLDANENHGMGDKYIKALFKLISNNNYKNDVFELLLLDYYSFTVYREWRNIDLLLISREEKVLVAIENKIGSKEKKNQLNRYRKILEREYVDYKRIYLYLTPDGDEPSDSENWGVITYQELVDELEKICEYIELLPDVKLLIRNYIETIRREIVEDQKLIEVCNKIYEKHRRALDLIFENRTDVRTEVRELLLRYLGEYEKKGDIKIEKASVSNTLIAFSTKTMDGYLPEDNEYINSWGTHTIYRFYIYTRHYPEITGKFEIGGSKFNEKYADAVDKITHIFKQNDKRKVFDYKVLFSTEKHKVNEDKIDESCKQIVDSLVTELLNKQEEVKKQMKEV